MSLFVAYLILLNLQLQQPSNMALREMSRLQLGTPRKTGVSMTCQSERMSPDGRPPWRGSDPVPKDTYRNNYLENDDEMEKVNKL